MKEEFDPTTGIYTSYDEATGTRYARRGSETHAVRGMHDTRYDGTPCHQFDLFGNVETYCSNSLDILQAQELGGGWVRYWAVPRDVELRKSLARLVELHEYGRQRGWE